MNTQVKVNYSEPTHTYKEWEQIHNTQIQKKKKNTIYFAKQKIAGIILIAIGVIIPFILDGDATASIVIIPMGLLLLFTKEKVMVFNGFYEE